MRIAIISLGGKSSKKIAQACKIYFSEVKEFDLRKFSIKISKDDGVKILYKGEDFPDFDCVYVRGSHKYAFLQRAISKQCSKKAYLPIDPKAFSIGHDKLLTTLDLQEEKVNVPQTYYSSNAQTVKELLDTNIKYPIIMKVQCGTHGKGVMIADNAKTAKGILDVLEQFKQPFIIQEFVPTENTSDIRAVVAGKKVLASYKRIACEGEFRANIHAGGKREGHKLTNEQKKMAILSAKTIKADICGVDILNSKDPSVIEINLSPAVHSLQEVTGKNVLNEIAKELYKKTIKFKEKHQAKIEKRIKKKEEKKKIKEEKNEKKLQILNGNNHTEENKEHNEAQQKETISN
jgi:ribosomal protein S6--L-glutamate ligase